MLHSQMLLGISFLACAVTVGAIQWQAAKVDYQCSSASAAPKLTIVTVTAGLPEKYVTALRTNRMLEANAYDYEFCEFKERQDVVRHPNWEKVKALQYAFALGKERLVWMDADAYFVKKKPFENITHNGEPVFEKLGNLDVIWTDDLVRPELAAECNINTGVIAMTNSSWTQEMWRGVWSQGKPAAEEHGNHDQPALARWKRVHLDEFNAHTMTIPHHLMNSVTERGIRSEFVAHYAGGGSSLHGHKYDELTPDIGSANSVIDSRTLTDVDFMAADVLPYLEEANRQMAMS